MIREVDLVSYLPPFMANFKEIAIALDAENPEFELVWKAVDRVLRNEFIETADEYGISRFEKILNILPSKEDTLENRRSRVQVGWFKTLPYTYQTVKKHLDKMCERTKFELKINYEQLTVDAIFEIEDRQKLREIWNYLEQVLPANLIIFFRKRNMAEFIQNIEYKNMLKIKNEFYARSNISYLKYDGMEKYNNTVQYDKYKSNEKIELYPIKLNIQSKTKPSIIFCPKMQVKGRFSSIIEGETKLTCKKEMEVSKKIEARVKVCNEVSFVPRYEIKLSIGKHPNHYNGVCCYDGKSRYYARSEEIL